MRAASNGDLCAHASGTARVHAWAVSARARGGKTHRSHADASFLPLDRVLESARCPGARSLPRSSRFARVLKLRLALVCQNGIELAEVFLLPEELNVLRHPEGGFFMETRAVL